MAGCPSDSPGGLEGLMDQGQRGKFGLEGITVASRFVGESYMARGDWLVVAAFCLVSGLVVDKENVLYHFGFRHFDIRLGFLCCRHHDAKSLLASGSAAANSRGNCDGLVLVSAAGCAAAGHGGIDAMRCKFGATFITIVPSPYQRDLFRALAARPEIELRVYYMEATSPGLSMAGSALATV